MKHTMTKLAAAMTLAGLSFAGTAFAQQAEDVKVGYAGPLTGAQAHYGKDMQNGITLAVEDFNATKPVIGGKPVRIVLNSADGDGARVHDARLQDGLPHDDLRHAARLGRGRVRCEEPEGQEDRDRR
jgi:hypothetical protein